LLFDRRALPLAFFATTPLVSVAPANRSQDQLLERV
jgi:hypothetical protein